jgi:branched-subunit amino acid aminotransferase/4-amino-4-deoxychorismate lyase
MTAVPAELFAVRGDGPQALAPPRPITSVHDLPADLPFGVYTVFRTFDHNKFLHLGTHLDRLEQSTALLGWKFTLGRPALRRALHQVCTAYTHADARVRVDILARPATQLDTSSRVLLTLAPFVPVPAALYEEGVRVGLAPRLHREQPRAKKADFALARQEYPRGLPDAYDYLLLDEAGRILEGSSSNFYAVREGVVWTAGEGVLAGVTRRIVLQLIAELEIPLRLQAVPLAAVKRLQEAFMSSSSRGLLPIVAIDGNRVGDGRPGPITRRLMAAYEQYVAVAIRPAIGPEQA